MSSTAAAAAVASAVASAAQPATTSMARTVILVRHAESAENFLMQGVARGLDALRQFSLPSYDDVRLSATLAGSLIRGAGDDEWTLSANGEAQVSEVRQLLLNKRMDLLSNSQAQAGSGGPSAPSTPLGGARSGSGSFESKHRDDSSSPDSSDSPPRSVTPVPTVRVFRPSKIVLSHSPLLRAKATAQGLFGERGELLSTASAGSDPAAPVRSTVTEVVELDYLREIPPIDKYHPTRWASGIQRIAEFEQWIAKRDQEELVVVVGHSHFFRHMLGVDFKFANCEVWRAKFSPSGESPRERWFDLERLCGSSTSKPTFGAEGPDSWNPPSSTDRAA